MLFRSLHAPGNQETSSTQRVNPSQSIENTKCKIKWPNQNETEKWRSLDDQLANILDVTMKGDIDTKLRTMTTVIYNLSKDQFGVKQPRCRNAQPETQSRRQITITNIRKDIKKPDKAIQTGTGARKTGVSRAKSIESRQAQMFEARRKSQAAQERKKEEASPIHIEPVPICIKDAGGQAEWNLGKVAGRGRGSPQRNTQ